MYISFGDVYVFVEPTEARDFEVWDLPALFLRYSIGGTAFKGIGSVVFLALFITPESQEFRRFMFPVDLSARLNSENRV